MIDLWIMTVGLICSVIFLSGMYFQYKIFGNVWGSIDFEWVAIIQLLIFSSIASYSGSCAPKFISDPSLLAYGLNFVVSYFVLYFLRVAWYKIYEPYYDDIASIRIGKNSRALKTLFFVPSLIALAVLVAVFLGSTASYVLISFDEKMASDVAPSDYKNILISASVLCGAFVVKSIFGMSVITVTLTWFAWNYFVHGDYSLSPIFTVVIDLVMGSMPMWAIWLYALFTLLYSLVSSIWLSVSE